MPPPDLQEEVIPSDEVSPAGEEPVFSEQAVEQNEGETTDYKVETLDVRLKLSEEEEKEIVGYLEDNLPRMKPSDEEEQRIRSYLAMYDLAARKRNFPYENAPSLPSTAAHDALNDWLDQAETAFLQQKVTFSIDRESCRFNEESVRRMEKTMHRNFFLKSGFSKDIRMILFESSYLGGSVCTVRESYEQQPIREKIVIKSQDELNANYRNLTSAQIKEAEKLLGKGEHYITERDVLKIINIGPKVHRINRTRFWYPRGAESRDDWQICSEREFYTRSALEEMAKIGEIDAAGVKKAVESRRLQYSRKLDEEKNSRRSRSGLLEEVKSISDLDSNWTGDLDKIREMGDAYEDEFAIYRVTMLYNVPTSLEASAKLRTWIQVLYCPAGRCILSASYCQDGFPYHLIQYRPVPHHAIGLGIAHEQYAFNMMDSDLKSYFLAAIEQEMGAPLLIRQGSNLWASGFRAYPASVTYTQDIERDAKFMPYPDRSRLAEEGMKMVLGTNPSANKGAGYASGKREEILQGERVLQIKARLHSVATDLDVVFNAAWKVFCRMAKLNTSEKLYVEWVLDEKPVAQKLYVLENELDPNIIWSSVVSATSISPDARLQQALMKKQILHDKVPASVNSPRLTIAWSNEIANYFDDMDEAKRKELLPTQEDFQQYQQSLGQQGGERPNAPGPIQGSPAVAQSASTPFRNPAAKA